MSETQAQKYLPGKHPNVAPPLGSVGIVGWLRKNLFSSVFNTVLTLLAVWLLYVLISATVEW
ncbi:MAG: amino acid ABC transporter permease, partial [Rhodospirillales bacterium]|nr:amino acid ABC transporter permease [Rhodospirillales bacterium]